MHSRFTAFVSVLHRMNWNDKLLSEDELCNIYAMDALIPSVDSVLLGYRKKMDLLKNEL